MQLYRDIFQRSWKITHHHKSLWWLGALAILWGGKSIDLELFFTNSQLFTSNWSPFRPGFWDADRWSDIFDVLTGSPTPLLLLLLLLVFIAAGIGIVMVAQIGLIDAFGMYGKTKRSSNKRYSFDDAVHASEHHVLSVLGVNVLGKVVSYGLFVLVVLPLFLLEGYAAQLLTTLLLFVVIVPLTVTVSMITKYAANAIVLKDLPAREAIVTGWITFRKNMGISFEMALIMMLLFLLVNIVATVFASVVTLPLGIIAQVVLPEIVAALAYQTIALAVILMSIIFSSIIFSTWHSGSWTLLFMELTKGQKKAKLHRVLKGD